MTERHAERLRPRPPSQDPEFAALHQLCQDPASPLWDILNPNLHQDTPSPYFDNHYKAINPHHLISNLGQQFPAISAIPAAHGYNGYPQAGQASAQGSWHVNLPPRASLPVSWTHLPQRSDISGPVYTTHSVPQPTRSHIASTVSSLSTIFAYSAPPPVLPDDKCAISATPAVLRATRRVRPRIPCGVDGCPESFQDKYERIRHHQVAHAMATHHYHSKCGCDYYYPRFDKIKEHFTKKHGLLAPFLLVEDQDYIVIDDAIMLQLGYCHFYESSGQCDWFDKKIRCGFVASAIGSGAWLGDLDFS